MADAKLTALTAASALAGEDLFYISQGGVSKRATHTQLLTLVGTEYVAKAGGTMTGALTLPAGAVGTPSLMFTGAGATTGIYSAGSNEISFAVGGARVAYINAGNLLSTGVISASGGFNAAGGNFLISSNAGALAMGTSYDVWLYRDAAATLAQRNGTNAQTLRVYSSYTDASNYERLSLSTTAGSGVTIAAETLGTGADNLDIVLTPAGSGTTLHPVGTFSKPGIGFIGFTGTGMYTTLSGANVVLTGSGLPVLNVAATYCGFPTAAVVGWSSSGSAGANPSDVAFARNAAGIVEVCSGTAGTYRDILVRNVKTNPVAFASLVAAATAGNGARAMITNCSHATFGTAADGGGSTKVPVYSDGASWLVG